MPSCSPFASRSIPRHLARGLAGLLALAGSVPLLREGALGIMGACLAVVLALVLLRGCPMCWLLGLVETISLRSRRSTLPTVFEPGDERT